MGCQYCGKPAKNYPHPGGWTQTLCDHHYAKCAPFYDDEEYDD